jgi:hypothetical protein
MISKCDYCGRENAAGALRCSGCGSDRANPGGITPMAEPIPDDSTRRAAEKRMVRGALWCIGGILVTGTTYLLASGPAGGTYVIAWGAIVFGAVEFICGATGHKEEIDPEELAYHALEVATRLETEGRVQEAIAIYERIAQEYPNKPAGHDAQKSLESLRAKVG